MAGPISMHAVGLCSNATSQELVLPADHLNRTIRWSRICARDFTTALDRIDFWLRTGTTYQQLGNGLFPAAKEMVTIDPFVLAPGEARVGATYYGATAGDQLEIYAYGEMEG